MYIQGILHRIIRTKVAKRMFDRWVQRRMVHQKLIKGMIQAMAKGFVKGMVQIAVRRVRVRRRKC